MTRGTVVACGTPEEVAENPNSYTGKYIKMMLDENDTEILKNPELEKRLPIY